MYEKRDTDKFIDELIEIITMQEQEIRRLEQTISRIKQYIAVYEDYIQKG